MGFEPSAGPAALLSLALILFQPPAPAPARAWTQAQARPDPCRVFTCEEGGIVRGRTDRKELALIFTGGDYGEGGPHIRSVLKTLGVKAGFFFTGDFFRSSQNRELIQALRDDGHYLGPHSDKHLLYCDWNDRARTLVGREAFRRDLEANLREMDRFGIKAQAARLFIPPYEWYNREIVRWAADLGWTLFNFTPGTTSNADYTTPGTPEYLSAQTIYDNILNYERRDPRGLNGFILLVHIGTAPERTDKLYNHLESLLKELRARGYALVRIDELLASH